MTTFKVKNRFANRGKKSEDAMAKFLSEWSSPFKEANRLVDSKAAGRIIKAAAADFEYFALDRGHGLIEVKETEHEYRLARDKVPQLARLRKRANCGGVCLVAVFHSTLQVWRVVDTEYLTRTGDKGSWNLSDVPAYTVLATAMEEACPGVFG
jgi:hypothetical protein